MTDQQAGAGKCVSWLLLGDSEWDRFSSNWTLHRWSHGQCLVCLKTPRQHAVFFFLHVVMMTHLTVKLYLVRSGNKTTVFILYFVTENMNACEGIQSLKHLFLSIYLHKTTTKIKMSSCDKSFMCNFTLLFYLFYLIYITFIVILLGTCVSFTSYPAYTCYSTVSTLKFLSFWTIFVTKIYLIFIKKCWMLFHSVFLVTFN